MATKKELEHMLEELIPLLKSLEEFNEKYSDIIREYNNDSGIVTEEDRKEAAIKIINKYSNL